MSKQQVDLSGAEDIEKLHILNINKTHKHPNRKIYNQYFTPEFIVENVFSFVRETEIQNIIDPAVGNGVFVKKALEKWKNAKLFGIDIDKNIIFELKKYHPSNSYIICGDSLLQTTWQLPKIQEVLLNGGFDLVVGNPPFSSWFHRVGSNHILINYELGKNDAGTRSSQAIEVLFLEVFIKLAKRKGLIVIVLPEGILANPQYQYVREFVLKNTMVLDIISLPRNVFDETSAKTSILILRKNRENNANYFAKLHDLTQGGEIGNTIEVSEKDLIRRMDYHYHSALQEIPLQELVNDGTTFGQLNDFVIYCKTGKTLYGKERKFHKRGLRFLHATNITDIGIDYKKDERFIEPSSKMNFPSAHVKVRDILFVRVGVGCAGRVAIVDAKNEEGVATDYIHIIRVKNISPYFLVVYLKTKYGLSFIKLLRHGVGAVSINKTEILSIPIPIVPERMQTEIEIEYKKILTEYRINGADSAVKEDIFSLVHYLEKELQGIGSVKDERERAVCYVEV